MNRATNRHWTEGKEALISAIRHLLSAALQDNENQRVRIAELLRSLYGRRSERFHPDQLSFGLLAVAPEPQAASEPEPAASAERTVKKPAPRRAGHRGCHSLPAHLPREEIRLQPTEEQLAATGGQMRKWREERSEVLEYVPAYLKVQVYVREVWSNAYGEVVTAPVPVKLIAKGLPGPALLVQVLLSRSSFSATAKDGCRSMATRGITASSRWARPSRSAA